MSDQPSIWTPSIIATVVYRVVMVFVSLAFIWKKYRRPRRRIDEEQLIGTLLPISNNPHPRPRASNSHPRRQQPQHASRFYQVRGTQFDDIVSLAIELNDLESDALSGNPSVDSPNESLPVADSGSESTVQFDDGEVCVEMGDIGIRHRSAEQTVSAKQD